MLPHLPAFLGTTEMGLLPAIAVTLIVVAVFAAAGHPLRVEPDLDQAIELALAPLTGVQR